MALPTVINSLLNMHIFCLLNCILHCLKLGCKKWHSNSHQQLVKYAHFLLSLKLSIFDYFHTSKDLNLHSTCTQSKRNSNPSKRNSNPIVINSLLNMQCHAHSIVKFSCECQLNVRFI